MSQRDGTGRDGTGMIALRPGKWSERLLYSALGACYSGSSVMRCVGRGVVGIRSPLGKACVMRCQKACCEGLDSGSGSGSGSGS